MTAPIRHTFTIYRAATIQNGETTQFPFTEEIRSEIDLERVAKWDHTAFLFSPEGRAKDNYLQNDLIIMDVDNTHSEKPEEWKTVNDICRAFPDVEFYTTPSRNHMKIKKGKPARPKFHVYFPLSRQMNNAEEARTLIRKTMHTFPLFDDQLKDEARMVFGTGREVDENAVQAQYFPGHICLDQLPMVDPEEDKPSYTTGKAGKKPSWNAETDPWDGKTIPEGGRHGTILAHMAFYVKKYNPDDEALEAEFENVLSHIEGTMGQPEIAGLKKSAFQWRDKMNRDPNYFPNLDRFKKEMKQQDIEEQQIIKKWDGISEDALTLIQEVDENQSRYAQLIKRFNGMKRWSNPEKNARMDLESLLRCSKKIGKGERDRRVSAVEEVFTQSAFYARFKDELFTTTLPDGEIYFDHLLAKVSSEYFIRNKRENLKSFKTEHGTFLNEVASLEFLERYSCGYDPRTKRLFVYMASTGHYTTDPEELDRMIIQEFLSDSKQCNRRELLASVKGLAPELPPVADDRYIAFKNGVLDIETGELLENSPEFFFLNRIPHNYNPNAAPVSVIDEALKTWSCDDPIVYQNLIESAGYAMYRGMELQCAFFLTGKQSNGKSVFLDLLEDVLGEENCCSVPVEKLEERFQTSPMFGKLANISRENEPRFIQRTEMLKKLTDGSAVEYEFKGQTPFKDTNTATGFYSFNELPRFRDPTGAVKRRIKPIPFLAHFTDNPDEVDPEKRIYLKDVSLPKKLKEEPAIEYFITLAIKGLRDLLKRGSFPISERGKESLEEIDLENNHVNAFVAEIKETDGEEVFFNHSQSTRDLYFTYLDFCEDRGIKAKSMNGFVKDLVRITGAKGTEVKRLPVGKGGYRARFLVK